jgi:hypothetical protein
LCDIVFSQGANPFQRVCPFCIDDICNRNEIIQTSGFGKKSQVLASPIFMGESQNITGSWQ